MVGWSLELTKKRVMVAVVIGTVLLLSLIGSIMCLKNRSHLKEGLFAAIKNNDIKTVMEIIDQSPSLINEHRVSCGLFGIDRSSNTPLLEACNVGNIDMIRFLVEKGADVNKGSNVVRAYPLLDTLENAKTNRYEIAWYLIKNGASLEVVDRFYSFPFAIVSCRIGDNDTLAGEDALEMLLYAINNGVSLEAKEHTRYGITCLLGLAARKNYTPVCKYLLDNEYSNINDVVDEMGATALIVATQEDAYGTCKMLLEYGADKDIVDIYGMTAYDYALETDDAALIALLSENTPTNY